MKQGGDTNTIEVVMFSALALAFVLSLMASFVVAMTVIPLFCSRFLKHVEHAPAGERGPARRSWGARFNAWFNRGFGRLLDAYEHSGRWALKRPGLTVAALTGLFVA
jgi:multidrug efflux pump subunit AcrB